jgi:hypothetical protein
MRYADRKQRLLAGPDGLKTLGSIGCTHFNRHIVRNGFA